MLGFYKRYFFLAALLLLLEIFIGTRVHDQLIRPYAGDFLITIFLYCLVRSFWVAPAGRVVAGVLGFSYLIEILQYFHLVSMLGLQHSRVARIVLGTQFAWGDMLAYTLGALLVLALEKRLKPWLYD